MKSTRPFPETFRSLREDRDLSERQVSARAADHDGPGHSTLHKIYSGENLPLPHHLIAIAAALGVPPETFAEYRLWEAMRLFDVFGEDRRNMGPIPWDQAMHNLERFEDLKRLTPDLDNGSFVEPRHSAKRHLRSGSRGDRAESA